MRAITKGPEPPSLTRHRQTQHSYYDNYADKDELRRSLIAEQRGICCYCMARIRNGPTTVKIEHWRCKACHPGQQISYQNLLAACPGGEGQPQQFQHCDTRKGDHDLEWNPADPTHHIETRIGYEMDGTIFSDDAVFDAQLREVLNLNLPLLKNNRKAVLTGILDWWKREKMRLRGPVPRARLERERDRPTAGGNDLEPYCQVVVWWLEQRLTKMA